MRASIVCQCYIESHWLNCQCLFATRLRSAAFVIVTIDFYLLDGLAFKGILSHCVLLFEDLERSVNQQKHKIMDRMYCRFALM